MITCSQSATIAASRSRRPVSSSAKTSSRTSTGSSPRSCRSSWYAASLSPSANDQDSPWLAYPLAGSSPRVSTHVVAVRADEADPALDLLVAHLRERGEQLGFSQLLDLGHLARRDPAARSPRAATTCRTPGRRTARR